jgi:anti-sigma factor RsiW
VTDPIPIGEDDLQAHLDGRLSPGRAAMVEAYLAAHSEAAARLARYAEQQEALRAALQPKFDAPIPARMRVDSILSARRQRRGAALSRIAAVVLMILFGAAGGWYANNWTAGPHGPSLSNATANAVDAYRTFSADGRHPVELRADQKPQLVRWLSGRLDRPVRIPDLSALGFHLMGGRLLPTAHAPAAQLMYHDGRGTRLTIYLQPMGVPGTEFRYSRIGGVTTVYWARRHMAFAVTAATGRKRVLRVAREVYDQLGRGPAPK